MPRGVYERGKKEDSGIALMNKQELQEVEDKNKDKVSPFTTAGLGIKAKPAEPVPGTHRTRVGNFVKPAIVGHSGTLRDFARIEIDHEAEGWIPMSWEQMNKYQDDGVLAGWDGDKMLGLLKQEKPKGRKR